MENGTTQPNVLIIQSDQQSCWTLGCYGGSLIQTPHIDSLAAQGVRFTQFFANSAVCTPSRGSFLTGRYPHSHGAYRNGMPLGTDEITIAHLLREQGYDTGYAGKWHLDGEPSQRIVPSDLAMGFSDCRYMLNGHFKEVREAADGSVTATSDIGDETTYMTDWLADKTVDFLRTPRNKPFLFMVSFPDPHQPFKVRPPYDTMFDPQQMPIPVSFYEEKLPDWADRDEWGRKRYFPLHMANREQKLQTIKAQYCGEVKCIDDNVGKILRCLQERELEENTLVVFLTDHGEYMGEHGLLEKNNLYETAYRIPLLMRWPEKLVAGATIERIVTMVDVLPTLLGLLGIPGSGREQGRDASPLLTGRKTEWTDEAFIHPNDVPRAGLFTPEYELAYVGRGWRREAEHQFKDHILFDRVHDPEQCRNLFNDPAYACEVAELTRRIVAHHKQLGTKPDLLPEALHRFWDESPHSLLEQ